jgi:ubiquinone/menaquinone biosynthesis C-methylase UbiE
MNSNIDFKLLSNSGLSNIKINLGCGVNEMNGFFGIDQLNLPGVAYVADLENGLSFIPDNSVDEIYSSHFLEHINNFKQLMNEIHRCLKPDGIVNIIVPHFSNPYFYSDYTHKRFFGLYSFDYFGERNSRYKRRVPNYNPGYFFQVEKRKLVFKSPVFPLSNLFKKYFIQVFFNLNPYMQEVYESFFSNKIYCTEIHFKLKPVK